MSKYDSTILGFLDLLNVVFKHLHINSHTTVSFLSLVPIGL